VETSYRYQIVSDVIRDGLGVEFLDAGNKVVAEVFRCDRDKTTVFELFEQSVPESAIPALIELARRELRTYEDGTPIGEVNRRDV
jgi:hypothetical protein